MAELALAQEIKAYLRAHPAAADTIEGITKWWLARQLYQRKREDVHKALELLLTQGAVAKRQLCDGRFLYAKATKRRDSAE